MKSLNLSVNWKITLAFILILLASVPFEALNPSDGTTSIFQLVFGFLFVIFIWHLIAQRGKRVGFSYGATFVCAVFAIPLTAFVVYVVRRPKIVE